MCLHRDQTYRETPAFIILTLLNQKQQQTSMDLDLRRLRLIVWMYILLLPVKTPKYQKTLNHFQLMYFQCSTRGMSQVSAVKKSKCQIEVSASEVKSNSFSPTRLGFVQLEPSMSGRHWTL